MLVQDRRGHNASTKQKVPEHRDSTEWNGIINESAVLTCCRLYHTCTPLKKMDPPPNHMGPWQACPD